MLAWRTLVKCGGKRASSFRTISLPIPLNHQRQSSVEIRTISKRQFSLTPRAFSTQNEDDDDEHPNRNLNIAFIGLGKMGTSMCLNLLNNSKPGLISTIDVHDSDRKKMESLQALHPTKIEILPEIRDICTLKTDVIFTMLPNCASVVETVDHLLHNDEYIAVLKNERFDNQLTVVDCSTISPIISRDLHKKIRDGQSHGLGRCEMLDAPVSGGVKGAANGTLTFMVGGNASTLSHVEDLLLCMGDNVIHCGDDGKGTVAKLCTNLALASQMMGICEAMNLGNGLGIDPTILAGVMNSSTAKCWSSEVCNPDPIVAAGVGGPASLDYEGGFDIDLMVKDADLAVGAGAACDVSLPVGALSKELYRQVKNRGHGKKDFGIMMQFLRGKL
eukprot:CAMPEP_0194382022 /NCGR_PEP_ID=MMETSP0174-20130528/57454_1 /TAXON_ID=216777 /ORGANISM="Proboscia alata, Strain PI-D3" /LENGTH=387 /DNA_ID=CAMNT_0039166937 /DNA_START=87 /DNA_END=1250 /DNA_ORIENTATION=+